MHLVTHRIAPLSRTTRTGVLRRGRTPHPQPLRAAGSSASAHCVCGGRCPRCRAEQAIAVSQPGDALERGADSIAERVMRSPALDSAQGQKKAAMSAGTLGAPQLGSPLNGGGTSLDDATRRFFEPRLHTDLAGVRVHTGAAAARLAHAYGARAFTLGEHIVFNAGEYAPHTGEGKRLMAHELAHVQQQRQMPALARQVLRTPYPGCDRRTSGVDDADARIDAAREQALRMVRAARAAFPRMNSRTIRNVDRHFHCPSASQTRTIMRTLEAIEAALPTLSVSCVDARTDFCRESEYVRGRVTDGLAELCPASFRADARAYRLAGTFIHAAAITAGAANLCMKREPCYDDFTLAADAMIGNSYSYTWFAIEQAGHDIGSPPTVPCAPSNTGENVVVPPGADTDPSLIRPLTGYDPIPRGSRILPVFSDRAGNRFIYHDDLPGAQQFMPGERKRYYLPARSGP
jgi:hypothetical protein